ncbi:MAG: hypothetical protein MJA84_01650 [Firmicutes bacterium]|nr:hypothetical protein [Bacillota bacterium]
MPNEFVTTDYLFTFVGMVLVLGLVVQFTKGLFKKTFNDWVVRAYAFSWAIVLVLVMYWHQGLFDAAVREIAITVLLALINAVIVTMATIGGYDVLADPKAEKRK